MADLNMIKPQGVQNLINKFCYTIGMLPTSYKSSLTYEEQILAIGNYLETKVYPAINNNAEALTELQGLFTQLYNYVHDYFENLDVTEEINAKLDEMADDGTLAEIIEDYATIPELTTRVETVEGKVGDLEEANLPTRMTAVENDIEEITQKEKFIIMGDSYGAMSNDTWIDKVITLIGNKADCEKVALGGAGFAHVSSLGYSFLTYLQHVEADITDKNRVTKIIVGGGYNDNANTYAEITAAITSFCNYCHDTYPNAKIYIACIGFNKALTTEGATIRANLENIVIPAYSANLLLENDPIYIANSENILQNDALIDVDNVHPTALGQEYLAKRLYPYIMYNAEIKNDIIQKVCNLTYNSVNYQFKYKKNDNNAKIQSVQPLVITSFPANTEFVSGSALTSSLANYIGDIALDNIYPSNDMQLIKKGFANINCTEGNFRNIPCEIWLRYNRKLYFVMHLLNSAGTAFQTFTNVSYLSFNDYIDFDISNS